MYAEKNLTGSRICGGNTAYTRCEKDFYPTPPEVTQALIDFLGDRLNGKRIWECACGTGYMSEVFVQNGFNVFSSDIRKTGYGCENVDFLEIDTLWPGWIITNPPFSLAERFIRKANELSGNFAFLLKSQYWHSKNRLSLFEEMPPAYIIPLTWRPDFLFRSRGKGAPLMDCIWCVWMRGETNTRYIPIRKPPRIAVALFERTTL